MGSLLEIFTLLLEDSKNDAIPEIVQHKDKLALFLFGNPGVGKTTFYKRIILPRNPNFKYFNSDRTDHILANDRTSHFEGSTELTAKATKIFTNTKQNFIFDCTGKNMTNVTSIIEAAQHNGYNCLFIHLFSTLSQSYNANLKRTRVTDPEYLKDAYAVSNKLISFYSLFNPLAYYVVINLSNKYVFYEYKNKKLTKKKSVEHDVY